MPEWVFNAIAGSADLATYAIVYLLWKMERRVLALELGAGALEKGKG